MVGILQTIYNVAARATGFKEAAAQVAQVGVEGAKTTREFNRMGQASASSGRQFSAQAQGLGGLVASYAGAAATVFALQQAFSALKSAAELSQIIQGTNTLAANIGESGDKIIKVIQQITKGQVTLKDVAQSVNIGLSAGFDTTQLESLASIALTASRALGRDLTDSMNRLLRGTAKLEPELLDELGIFTRIDPAVNAYAISVGKSVSALTTFEKRQAFANAVIEEGQRKFSNISSSGDSASSSLEKLASTLIDVATKFGNFVATALVPLANFFSGSLANAYSAFALLSALVLQKAGDVFQGFLKNVQEGIQKKIADAATKAKVPVEKLSEAIVNLKKESATGKFNLQLGQRDPERSALIQSARGGTLDFVSAQKLQDKLTKEADALPGKIAKAQLALSKSVAGGDLAKVAQDNKALKALQQQEVQVKNLSGTIGSYLHLQDEAAKREIASQSRKSKLLAGATKTLDVVTRWTAKIFTFIAVVELVGSLLLKVFNLDGVFDKLIDYTTQWTQQLFNITDQTKQIEAGFKGLSSAALADTFKQLGVNAKDTFQFQESFLFGLLTVDKKKGVEKLSSDLSEIIQEVNRKTQEDINQFPRTPGDAFLQQKLKEEGSFREFNIKKARSDYIKNNRPYDTKSAQALEAFVKAFDSITEYSANTAESIGKISSVTGVSSEVVAKNLKSLISDYYEAGRIVGSTVTLGESGIKLQLLGEEKLNAIRESGLKTAEQDYLFARKKNETIARLAEISSNQLVVGQEIKDFNLSEEALAQRRAGIIGREKTVQREILELYARGTEEAVQQADVLEKGLFYQLQKDKLLIAEIDKRLAIANLTKEINNTFQTEIAAAGKLTGLFDKHGNLATSQLDIRKNELSLLDSVLARNTTLIKDAGEREQVEQQQALAVKAIVGMYVKTVTALKDMNVELDKITTKLQEEISILTQERVVQTIKNEISAQEDFLRNLEQVNKFEVENMQIAADTASLRARAGAAAIQAQIDILSATKNVLDAQEEYNKLLADAKKLEIERSHIMQNFSLDLTKDIQSAFGNMFSTRQGIDLELKIKERDLDQLKELTSAQVEESQRSTKARLEILQAEEKIALKQIDLSIANAAAEQQRLIADKAILDATISNTRNELEQRNKIFDKQVELARAEAKLQQARIDSEKALADVEIRSMKLRIDAIVAEGEILRDHKDGIAKALATHVVELTAAGGPEALYALANERGINADTTTDFTTLRKTLIESLKADFSSKDLTSSITASLARASSQFADYANLVDKRTADQKVAAQEALQESIRQILANKTLNNAEKEQQIQTALKRKEQKDIEISTAGTQIAAQEKIRDLTKENFELQKLGIKLDSDNKIKQLQNELLKAETDYKRLQILSKLSKDEFFLFANDFIGIVKDKLTKGLQDLNEAVVTGTLTWKNFKEGFRDWAYQLTLETQKALFQRTVIEPVTSFVTESLSKAAFDIFGIKDLMGPGTINNTVTRDSLGQSAIRVTWAGQTTGSNANAPGTAAGAAGLKPDEIKAQDEGWKTFTGNFLNYGIALGGAFTAILASGMSFKSRLLVLFSSIFAQLLTNMLRTGSAIPGFSFGSLFSSIFGRGGTSPSAIDYGGGSSAYGYFASGGYIRNMAYGGNMLRDRVAANLEPGEFVVRKPMAERIGYGNLQRMNATGNAAPNVDVNVINQGTAQQPQGKPRVSVDGEKIIVDIVLRDLENNGPIRQTLRSKL